MITFDQKLAELLMNNLNIDGWPFGNLILCVIAIVLSILLCGTIGMEREIKGRSAGLRTHLLVGVGSCVVMIISIYGFPAVFADRDVARLAAQIITGIGFLGAGAIMHRSTGINGLTTAATIWVVMAIGIACGSFNFILATGATILILLVLTVFRKVEAKINSRNPIIILTVPSKEPVLDTLLNVSKQFDCTVHGLSVETNIDGQVQMTFQAEFHSGGERLMEYISALEKETKAVGVQLLGHR